MEKERREDSCLFLPVYFDARPSFTSLLVIFVDSIRLDILVLYSLTYDLTSSFNLLPYLHPHKLTGPRELAQCSRVQLFLHDRSFCQHINPFALPSQFPTCSAHFMSPPPWVMFDSAAQYDDDCRNEAEPDIAGVGVCTSFHEPKFIANTDRTQR